MVGVDRRRRALAPRSSDAHTATLLRSPAGEESISLSFLQLGIRQRWRLTSPAIEPANLPRRFPSPSALRPNGKHLYEGGRKRSLRLKAPPELASDGARDHEAIIVADAKKGKSKGKQLARPILGTGMATAVRMLSSMAACRLHCDRAWGDSHLATENAVPRAARRAILGRGIGGGRAGRLT